MAYVVVVLTILNGLALAYAAWHFWTLLPVLEETIRTSMNEEVKKQDDRIEKRLQRAQGQESDLTETSPDGIMAGRPLRR